MFRQIQNRFRQAILLLTYDAYIPIHKINRESDADEKRAYIELKFAERKGFLGVDLVKHNDVLQVVIKFNQFDKLQWACKAYNKMHSECKAEIKKYYHIGYECFLSKDFKIIDVPDTISNDQIIKSFYALTRKTDFIIRNRNSIKDVYFHTSDQQALIILKESWSMIIENNNYRIGPRSSKGKISKKETYGWANSKAYKEIPKHRISGIFLIIWGA